MSLKETLRQYLKDELDRQDQHGLVVWYDPHGTLQPLMSHVLPAGSQLLKFGGSYLALRFELERCAPKFDGRWVIYIPESSLSESWLRDWELFGSRLELDLLDLLSRKYQIAVTPQLRQLLREHPENARDLIIHWDDLLAHQRRITPDVITESLLALAMGLSSWQTEAAILTFICGENWQERLNQHGLWESFCLIVQAFGGWASLSQDESGLRNHLQASILLSELISITPSLSERFSAILPAENKRRVLAVAARHWREREGWRSQYIVASQKVEHEYELSRLFTTEEHLLAVETFPSIDTLWRRAVVESIAVDGSNYTEKAGRIRKIASTRAEGFWVREHRAAYWVSIKLAADLYEGSKRAIEESASLHSIQEFIARYTSTDGWWQLDKFALEAAAHAGDLNESERKRLLYPAWRLYGEYLDRVNRAFVEAVAHEGWQLSQPAFWIQHVSAKARTAVFMVDAMRFDLAQTLLTKLCIAGLQVGIKSLHGVLPSVTELGMSALLPEAQSGLGISLESSRLCVQLHEQDITTREERINWLSAKLPQGNKVVRLDQIEQETLDGVSLLVILSRELDTFGTFAAEIVPNGFIELMDRLERAVIKLANEGFERILLAPDHGFLFLPKGVEARKIDRPLAGIAKPRFAIGANPDGCYVKTATELGLAGDVTLAFPIGLTCFGLQGESGVFLHGGLSLQETVLPVLEVKPVAITNRVGAVMEIPASLTSRIALIKVKATEADLFARPRKVVVEINGHRSQVIELSSQQIESVARVEWLGFSDDVPEEVKVILKDAESLHILEEKKLKVEIFM